MYPVSCVMLWSLQASRMSAISKPLRIDEEIPARLESLCGADLGLCLDGMRTVWEEQTAAAERHDD